MFKKRVKKEAAKAEDVKAQEPQKAPEEGKEEEKTEIEAKNGEDAAQRSGPYDASDPNIPEGAYLDLGSLKVLGKPGLSMRLTPSRDGRNIEELLFTYGSSSLQLVLLASSRRVEFWPKLKEDLLSSQKGSSQKEGKFGDEVHFTVKAKEGAEVPTRIVGVDGPRWMLRGIFTGPAAQEGEEKDFLDDFFSTVVADRGKEPLAPGDSVPLLFPPQLLPQNMEKIEQGPEMVDVTTKQSVQETLERGPMFTEIR